MEWEGEEKTDERHRLSGTLIVPNSDCIACCVKLEGINNGHTTTKLS